MTGTLVMHVRKASNFRPPGRLVCARSFRADLPTGVDRLKLPMAEYLSGVPALLVIRPEKP